MSVYPHRNCTCPVCMSVLQPERPARTADEATEYWTQLYADAELEAAK